MSGSAGLRLSPDPLSGEQSEPHGGAVGPVAPLPEPGVRTQGALRERPAGARGRLPGIPCHCFSGCQRG